jgi:hypothetical protein
MKGLINFFPMPTSAWQWWIRGDGESWGEGTSSGPFWKRYTRLSLLHGNKSAIQNGGIPVSLFAAIHINVEKSDIECKSPRKQHHVAAAV